jgi:hypothetical protein
VRIHTVNLIAFGAGIFFCLFAILSVKPDDMRDRPCTAGANNTKLFQTFGFIFGLIIASVIFGKSLCLPSPARLEIGKQEIPVGNPGISGFPQGVSQDGSFLSEILWDTTL